MKISVIIPTLNEEGFIGPCLERLRASFSGEIIVVDGKSEDQTVIQAERHASQVLSAPRGLARQLNSGASAAGGDVLFFVSADCLVPQGWLGAIEKTLQSPELVAGGFRLALEDRRLKYRLVAWGGNLRSRYFRLALADQGLFVRRAAFERVGGFNERSLIPHARLSRELQRQGRFTLLPLSMTASTRKWRKHGLVTTVVGHARTFLKFRLTEGLPSPLLRGHAEREAKQPLPPAR